MAVICHICVVSGVRECDPDLAEIKCELCGFCAAKKKLEENKND